MENHQNSPFDRPSQVFNGIRFVLLGYDPLKNSQLCLQVSLTFVNGGAVNVGKYGPNCTHVIVDKLVYDDPVCVAARRDGKILVSSLWADHSFDVGAPVDVTSVMYRPVRDLNGIPGAKSLVICLTGYQREDREDIMTMVGLMGAQFSKPLIANKVTHLICYKFEGEKYLLGKKMKKIKLINHRWLEDCLKAWKIVPEADYSKSGYELEMEAEAKDSEDELEDVTARRNERNIASPPHSLSSNQEVPKTVSNISASKVFNNAQETVSPTMKTTSNQFRNPRETKSTHLDTENVIDVTYGTSSFCEKTVGSSSLQNKIISASTLANKSPRNEARNVVSPMRTTSPTIDMKSNTRSAKRLNKFTVNDAFGMSSSLVQKVNTKTPNSDSLSCKRKIGVSSGSFELQKMSQNNDNNNVESALQELKDLDAVQRPQKKYKETSGMVENVIQYSAVRSDIQKSGNQNMEIDEQTGGSTSKSVRRKSVSKKFSAPGLTKKNTVNEKVSTFSKSSALRNDDEKEKLLKNRNVEEVFQSVKPGTQIDLEDETEPPEDKDDTSKQKHEHGEQENAVDVDQHNENLECKKTSRGNLTKKDNKKPEIRKESTPNRARRSKRNVNNSEKSTELQAAEDVSNDPNMDTANADTETENVVNKKEAKRNKQPLIKTKDSVKEVTDVEAVNVEDQSTGTKEVLKRGEGLHEKNRDKGSASVSKPEPMWFILAGHKLQRREFQQIIKRLKGRVCRVSHQWSYQATHFIVPDPLRRTEKFFAAAASGRWILKTDYLSASSQAGKFLAEEPYEWHKNGLSEDGQINLEAPRKWRLLKEKTGHGAFYGMRIIIYGECIAPPLDTLKRVVKAGDGTILATSPPYTRFLNTGIDFAVVSPGMPHVDIWVQEFLKHEIPCIYADYLVEFVCKPGYPLERHVQYDTNAWAERSYNKLKKRLEEEICEPRTPDSDDVACEVCGGRDRGEEMLICGDESGLVGCGVGTHIDCCDPPLEDVPEEDWFCVKCSKKLESKRRSKRKGSSSRG
ncbi:BRCT domain-containing protein At4g02110 isoform X1 [Helianthus annuus]|uniref:BRCT domain-containing protein At4g02110 isoform X1 n=1 Tax=Helianthus annuus TaxID=4232 RepID=UPI0016532352|nr:BRCT domain-containing protein At4g02110 isoform X1 [Helianthus annuus]